MITVREPAMAPMKLEQAIERHIGHAVAIGEHEGSIADERRTRPPESESRPVSMKWILPALLLAPAPFDRAGAEIDGEIARDVGELQDEVLHHLRFVAERERTRHSIALCGRE